MLYGSLNLTARGKVNFRADGFDLIGVEAVLALGFRGDFAHFLVFATGSVGPAVAAEVVLEVLDVIEFRRLRRQWNGDTHDPTNAMWSLGTSDRDGALEFERLR